MRFPFVILILISLLTGCTNIGDTLPDFETTTIDGTLVTDKQYEGKLLVINIWATWCGPCIQEIKALNSLVDKYKYNDDVVFIAITDESNYKVKNLLKSQPFKYTQIAEAKLLKHKLHPGIVKSIPFHIIIGKDGLTKFEYTGTREDIKDFLSAEIDKALSE